MSSKKPKNSARNSARSSAPGVPFRKGADPRRAKGGPGIGGRPKDEVRLACRAAFDERLPRLAQLADNADAGVALKALDMLAKYGGLNYTESESKVDAQVGTVAQVRLYQLADNGRGKQDEDEFDLSEPVTANDAPARAAPRASIGNGNGGKSARPVRVERRNWDTREPDGPDE